MAHYEIATRPLKRLIIYNYCKCNQDCSDWCHSRLRLVNKVSHVAELEKHEMGMYDIVTTFYNAKTCNTSRPNFLKT